MNMFEDSVTYQFIGNVTKGGDNAPADILNLPEGAVAIIDEAGSVYNGSGAVNTAIGINERMRIAQKVNGQLVFSPYFNSGQVRANSIAFSEEVPQITYLGYNGTDGELDDEDDATYTLGAVLQNTQGVLNNTPMIKTVPAYVADGDQETLARTLKTAFDRVMGKENRQSIVCERVADDTGETEWAVAAAEMLRVVNGSDTVTFHTVTGTTGAVVASNATTVTGDAIFLPLDNGREFEVTITDDDHHVVIIGDETIHSDDSQTGVENNAAQIVGLINSRMEGKVVASNAVGVITITYLPGFKALPPAVYEEDANVFLDVTTEEGDDTKAVYMQTSVGAATQASFTLDSPWTGPTGYISIEDPAANENTAGRVPAGTIAGADWGLMFVGQAPDPYSFNTVTETYHPVTFKLTWERVSAPADADADPTVVTYAQGAEPSRSSYFEVAAREIYATMNEGNSQISAYPPTNYRRAALPNARYTTYILNATDTGYASATTGQRPVSKYNIYVALESSMPQDDITEFEEFV